MSPTKPQTQRPLHSVETEKGVVSLASNKSVKLMIHIQPSGGPDMIRNWLLASDWWVCVVTVQRWCPLSSQSSSYSYVQSRLINGG